MLSRVFDVEPMHILATPLISTKGRGTPKLVQRNFVGLQKLTMALQAELLNCLMIEKDMGTGRYT